MSKMDERVLVFPRELQAKLVGLPGVVSHKTHEPNYTTFVQQIVPETTLMRRGDVEDNPGLSQVIPYTVVEDANSDRLLVYNRGAKGGERRLADKWSIGFGGHMNKLDVDFRGDVSIVRAATREIYEELAGAYVSTMGSIFDFLGFIYITDTPVDAVHFGVVFRTFTRAAHLLEPTDEATQLCWVTREELKKYTLENWSALVRDKLLPKENA